MTMTSAFFLRNHVRRVIYLRSPTTTLFPYSYSYSYSRKISAGFTAKQKTLLGNFPVFDVLVIVGLYKRVVVVIVVDDVTTRHYCAIDLTVSWLCDAQVRKVLFLKSHLFRNYVRRALIGRLDFPSWKMANGL